MVYHYLAVCVVDGNSLGIAKCGLASLLSNALSRYDGAKYPSSMSAATVSAGMDWYY